MGLFSIFKKKENDNNKKDIFSIPYDYTGYDIRFEEGYTDVNLYKKINDIVTLGKVDIEKIEGFSKLNKNSSEDDFDEFYDKWIDKLQENGYVIHQDSSLDIRDFALKVNKALSNLGATYQIDVEKIAELYNDTLNEYTLGGKPVPEGFNYDILENNLVAGKVRGAGYELINFFNGFDNYDVLIIKADEVGNIKAIEEKLNHYN